MSTSIHGKGTIVPLSKPTSPLPLETVPGPGRGGRGRLLSIHQSSVLLLLGVIMLTPLMWMQIDGGSSMNEVAKSVSGMSMFSETGEQRMLLGSSSLFTSANYEGDERQCRPPSPKHSMNAEGRDGRRGGNETSLHGFLDDLEYPVPELEMIHEWLSNKTFPRESITLMTHLSSDRLAMLENQCFTWKDRLIAVVYVPLMKQQEKGKKPTIHGSESSLDDIVRGISSFHSFLEGTGACGMHIELVGQYVEDVRAQPYPINALRNRALSLASTDLVFVLDVDFIASPLLGLPEPGYRDVDVYAQLVELTMDKKALVVPAFEVTNKNQDLEMGQNYARNLVLSGKEEVKKGYQAGLLDAFNAYDAPWGHGPTNTSKWMRLSKPILYKVKYEPKYEPFVLLARSIAPWADERFVGYGGNKIAYINHLQGLGYSFHVHPYGYSIHVPHRRTKEANIFVAHKKHGHAAMESLRARIEEEIHEGVFIPVVSGCPEELDDEIQQVIEE